MEAGLMRPGEELVPAAEDCPDAEMCSGQEFCPDAEMCSGQEISPDSGECLAQDTRTDAEARFSQDPGSRLLQLLDGVFSQSEQDIRSYAPLTLAYIGDAVYELLVRSVLVRGGNMPVNRLNQRASRLECAARQSAIAREILPELTEEERDIYRRGRNAHSQTRAKNASLADYRRATGLEALFGYLYLTGKLARAAELLRAGAERTGDDLRRHIQRS